MTSPIPVSLYCFVAVLFSLSSSSFSLFDKRIGVSVLSQNKISRRYSYIRYGTGNSLHGIEIKGGGGGERDLFVRNYLLIDSIRKGLHCKLHQVESRECSLELVSISLMIYSKQEAE